MRIKLEDTKEFMVHDKFSINYDDDDDESGKLFFK